MFQIVINNNDNDNNNSDNDNSDSDTKAVKAARAGLTRARAMISDHRQEKMSFDRHVAQNLLLSPNRLPFIVIHHDHNDTTNNNNDDSMTSR